MCYARVLRSLCSSASFTTNRLQRCLDYMFVYTQGHHTHITISSRPDTLHPARHRIYSPQCFLLPNQLYTIAPTSCRCRANRDFIVALLAHCRDVDRQSFKLVMQLQSAPCYLALFMDQRSKVTRCMARIPATRRDIESCPSLNRELGNIRDISDSYCDRASEVDLCEWDPKA